MDEVLDLYTIEDHLDGMVQIKVDYGHLTRIISCLAQKLQTLDLSADMKATKDDLQLERQKTDAHIQDLQARITNFLTKEELDTQLYRVDKLADRVEDLNSKVAHLGMELTNKAELQDFQQQRSVLETICSFLSVPFDALKIEEMKQRRLEREEAKDAELAEMRRLVIELQNKVERLEQDQGTHAAEILEFREEQDRRAREKPRVSELIGHEDGGGVGGTGPYAVTHLPTALHALATAAMMADPDMAQALEGLRTAVENRPSPAQLNQLMGVAVKEIESRADVLEDSLIRLHASLGSTEEEVLAMRSDRRKRCGLPRHMTRHRSPSPARSRGRGRSRERPTHDTDIEEDEPTVDLNTPLSDLDATPPKKTQPPTRTRTRTRTRSASPDAPKPHTHAHVHDRSVNMNEDLSAMIDDLDIAGQEVREARAGKRREERRGGEETEREGVGEGEGEGEGSDGEGEEGEEGYFDPPDMRDLATVQAADHSILEQQARLLQQMWEQNTQLSDGLSRISLGMDAFGAALLEGDDPSGVLQPIRTRLRQKWAHFQLSDQPPTEGGTSPSEANSGNQSMSLLLGGASTSQDPSNEHSGGADHGMSEGGEGHQQGPIRFSTSAMTDNELKIMSLAIQELHSIVHDKAGKQDMMEIGANMRQLTKQLSLMQQVISKKADKTAVEGLRLLQQYSPLPPGTTEVPIPPSPTGSAHSTTQPARGGRRRGSLSRSGAGEPSLESVLEDPAAKQVAVSATNLDEVRDSLASHARQLEYLLQSKADRSWVLALLDTKADSTNLAKKSDRAYVDAMFDQISRALDVQIDKIEAEQECVFREGLDVIRSELGNKADRAELSHLEQLVDRSHERRGNAKYAAVSRKRVESHGPRCLSCNRALPRGHSGGEVPPPAGGWGAGPTLSTQPSVYAWLRWRTEQFGNSKSPPGRYFPLYTPIPLAPSWRSPLAASPIRGKDGQVYRGFAPPTPPTHPSTLRRSTGSLPPISPRDPNATAPSPHRRRGMTGTPTRRHRRPSAHRHDSDPTAGLGTATQITSAVRGAESATPPPGGGFRASRPASTPPSIPRGDREYDPLMAPLSSHAGLGAAAQRPPRDEEQAPRGFHTQLQPHRSHTSHSRRRPRNTLSMSLDSPSAMREDSHRAHSAHSAHSAHGRRGGGAASGVQGGGPDIRIEPAPTAWSSSPVASPALDASGRRRDSRK